TLYSRGVFGDGSSDYDPKVHAGHVYTAIDIDENGTLYACDDETGALCAIAKGSSDVKTLVDGTGYNSVHANKGVISLCSSEGDTVTLCDASGIVASKFSDVRPSIGFSARMLVVWASGLYLLVLALVLGIRKIRWMIKNGKTESIAPLFTAVAIVIAIAVAIGNFSFASYRRMFELRANEINMCADYLDQAVFDLGATIEKIDNRDALRGSGEELNEAVVNVFDAIRPALSLTLSARENGIGMYCTLYGKDDKGVYYLYGSPSEYVMGSSAVEAEGKGLREAFEGEPVEEGKLRRGISLRDATQYRLVQIPTADGKSVAGVIEIGSKMRSFESSINNDLAQLTLGLLVMVLVVYLAYSELRACGRCLFSYRQRRQEDGDRAAAMLTRPFTLAITMLTSIDSVMTVLIARELLTRAGMGGSTPLLAVPAVMLGVGMVIGQGVYAITGSWVGLRKLVTIGAVIMFGCACFTGVAVASGVFWMYCVATLVRSIPFGMLYSLGYSLPRLAVDDETRALAAGGVKRTDTSAAALGTVRGG
ncbi:MAG: hypothetical protein IJH04_04805, partial [Eggerthellaceae bacterium]|nr:hypothetical protein [Eggerthellaceae bacterium]